jgi:protein translocase SecG subunit
MNKILTIIQIVTAILLIIVILMQNQGAGLSGTFGGSGGSFRTKRGAEKVLFYSTIVIAIIFFGTAVVKLIIG